MQILPTNPVHIARAYQTLPPKGPAPQSSDPIAGSIKPAPSSRIVAATVPGRVNFSGAEPAPSGPALAFYRHPADKNAAATSISAGRTLDIQA